MTARRLRAVLTLVLATGMTGLPALAQQAPAGPRDRQDYSKGRSHLPNIFAPYAPVRVPAPVLVNSPRIEQLIRDGQLHLGLQDAIALALENNLDITVQRYTPWLADVEVLRARARSGAAGVDPLDPSFTTTYTWDQRDSPVSNPFLAGTGVLLRSIRSHTTQANFSYAQGFRTGTNLSISFNNNRQSSTSPGQILNPSVRSDIILAVEQQLLNGFGLLPNTAPVRLAVNNKRAADLTFQEQVINTISSLQNMYWELVFAREDVKVKQRSVELAEKLYSDNKRQVEIGTLAPIEVVRAEAEVARTRQDWIVSQTFLLQQQTLLKNAITRNPMDPLVQMVEIIPTDSIVAPPQMEVVPLADAVKEAWQNRPDVKREEITLTNSGISVKSSRNALLPTVTAFATYGTAGLAGNRRPGTAGCDGPAPCQAGLGSALSDLFNNVNPTYTVGFSMNFPIRNRAAQASAAQALLQERQAEASLRRLHNQVVVEVRNAQIALEQSRARVQAASKSRELAERTLDAEQKKYQLGASTIFFVIQAQRDLAQAQSSEVRALADLLNARVEYERATGRTLQVHNIQMADAMNGNVRSETMIPGNISLELLGNGKK